MESCSPEKGGGGGRSSRITPRGALSASRFTSEPSQYQTALDGGCLQFQGRNPGAGSKTRRFGPVAASSYEGRARFHDKRRPRGRGNNAIEQEPKVDYTTRGPPELQEWDKGDKRGKWGS